MNTIKFSKAKEEASHALVNMLIKSRIVDIQHRDCLINTIDHMFYDYEFYPIEHTEIAITDTEEFEDLCKFYTLKKQMIGLSEDSITTMLKEIRMFHTFIKKRVSEVTSDDIDTYLIYLREIRKNKNTTVRSKKSSLSSFFTLLYKNKKIPSNPMEILDEPIKCEVFYEKVLTKTELTILEEHCETYRERAILSVFLETGVRLAECANLRIVDVDFQQKRIHVHHGKGGKDRIIPIGEKSLLLIKLYLTNERGDDFNNQTFPADAPLWASQRKPYKSISKDAIAELIYLLKERSGVHRAHPHLFRKTYATMLYKRGIGIRTISKLLGHTNLETLARYVIIDKSDIKRALNKI